ncbi:MAG: DUF975 family protein [Bacteroides sp.]|nr:DUF975 family protein [Bacteroides sp.]
MMIIFPVESENIIFKFICIVIASIFLIRLSLRVQLIPYFIYTESDCNKSALSVVKESWSLMSGKEGNLFMLLLRFTVLNLISILTLGIAGLWVFPYTIGSIYFFYHNSLSKPKIHSNIKINWSIEKIFTVVFIIVFWSCFIGLSIF